MLISQLFLQFLLLSSYIFLKSLDEGVCTILKFSLDEVGEKKAQILMVTLEKSSLCKLDA